MARSIIEDFKVTQEDVSRQLINQLTGAMFDIAVLRAENEKLKKMLLEAENLFSENEF
jgi:hypothetical protein